jgi:spermidine synthase
MSARLAEACCCFGSETKDDSMQSDANVDAMPSRNEFTSTKDVETTPAARPARGHDQSLTLIAIVATSGFAGLGYEIVWTRQLSLALGTEMMAVLGSIAGFFAGLALGAFALDGLIRRASSPRHVYAVLEAVIGIWGLNAIWLLPAAGRTLAPLLGSEPAPALLWAASFALPTLALLPAGERTLRWQGIAIRAFGGWIAAVGLMMAGFSLAS